MNFKYNLKWNGPVVLARLEREIKRAVRDSAERVRRAAKDPLLNTSGKSMTTRAGLNKGTLAERWNHGVRRLGDLSIINLGHKQIAFGGSTWFKDRKRRVNVVERVYWYGEPLHRWVQSSMPGSSPHKQTGTMQRSIAVEVINNGMRAKIGPGQNLKYARIQELGGRTRFGTLPPRPYMAPALAMVQPAILQDFHRAVARATK